MNTHTLTLRRSGRFLADMLRIRRVEYLIAEIPILLIPALVVGGADAFDGGYGGAIALLFFLLFNFGDMINCLADRELDARYKTWLSQAVYGLGVDFVRAQVWATAAGALALGAHLSWSLERWWILALVAVGLALGAAYSVAPARLKGRGLAQLACLWAILFVGPMTLVASALAAAPDPGALVLFAAYGAAQMGVILVNTAEDFPEDRAAGVRTSIVALGLRRGIGLAALLVGVAGACVLGWFAGAGAPAWALAVEAGAWGFVLAGVLGLYRAIRGVGEAEAIALVKARAKRVPAWVTVFAWSTLLNASVIAGLWK